MHILKHTGLYLYIIYQLSVICLQCPREVHALCSDQKAHTNICRTKYMVYIQGNTWDVVFNKLVKRSKLYISPLIRPNFVHIQKLIWENLTWTKKCAMNFDSNLTLKNDDRCQFTLETLSKEKSPSWDTGSCNG